MNMPKISVLMPIYNTNPQHLCEAIESILNQTYTDFEFLILNDSPDNKELDKIVKSYDDNRIIYKINEKNIGISGARNKLFKMAHGEYIAVMDHDDISLPDRFREEVVALDNDLSLGVVGCFYKKVDSQVIIEYPTQSSEIEIGLVFGRCYILHPSSMIRKNVLEKFNLSYEEEFFPSEDYALWCRLIGKTQFHNIPKVLFNYRDHAENTSKKQLDRMHIASQKIYNFVRKDHPKLWNNGKKQSALYKKILGIPIIKIKKKKTKTKYYLFYIPLFSITKEGI